MKTEIIYYSYNTDVDYPHSMLYGDAPEDVKRNYINKSENLDEHSFLQCPAFMDSMRNVYGVKTFSKIDLGVEDNGLYSDTHPQSFFESVHTHSAIEKIYSLAQDVMFIAESDSLLLSQEHPFFEDTKWSSDVNVIQGRIDIGKYFRSLNCSFKIKKGVNHLEVKEDDLLYYVRVHTDARVKFVPFHRTGKFKSLTQTLKFTHSSCHSWKPLKWYYEKVKKRGIKKMIMVEIKNNIM